MNEKQRTFKSPKPRRVWVSELKGKSEYYVKECCREWSGKPPNQVIQWYEWESISNPALNSDLPAPKPIYTGVATTIPAINICVAFFDDTEEECFVHNGDWEVSGGGTGFISAGGFYAQNTSELTYNSKMSRACRPDNSGLNSISRFPVVMSMATMRPRLFDICEFEPRPDQRVPFFDTYFFGFHTPIVTSVHGSS